MSDETQTSGTEPEGSAAPVAPATPVATETTPEKTFTQAEVDAIANERVNRSKAQYKDYAEFKAQAALVPGLQNQIAELNAAKSSAEADFNAAARDAQLLKVAIDKGVPPDLIDRLRGDTPEQIAADADVLVSKLGQRNPFGGTGFDGGAAPGATPFTPESADALLRRAAGY
jgi:hypothetical protein